MKRNPQVLAFMTPFPYSIDGDAPLTEAHALMRQHHFRHLPVTCNQSIIGILTDRDINLVLGPDPGSPDDRPLLVRDAYLESPCVVPASTPLAIVARAMAERRVGAAVVTKHDKLVGIFTVTDACRALAEVLEGHPDDSDSVA